MAVSSSQIDLSWTDASDNETGFKIERSTDGTTFAEIGTVGANVATYSDTGLAESTIYYYRVRAVNTGGDSDYSNTAGTTTLPSAPSNLAATAVSFDQIDLSWSDNSTGETGFKIERSSDAGATFTEIGTVGANATTHSDTGLTPLTPYSYRLRASSVAGDSAYSNTSSATTLPIP
jgi:fibronectin type III domain protein